MKASWIGPRSHSRRTATCLQTSSLATIALVEGEEGRVILASSIRHLLVGRASGGCSRAGAFSCLVTRIVPDNSEITALICYIDVVIIDGCSIVSHEPTKEAQKGEQEARQRRGIDNEAQRRPVVGSLLRAHARGPATEGRLRQ